jgi:hypothetical protein
MSGGATSRVRRASREAVSRSSVGTRIDRGRDRWEIREDSGPIPLPELNGIPAPDRAQEFEILFGAARRPAPASLTNRRAGMTGPMVPTEWPRIIRGVFHCARRSAIGDGAPPPNSAALAISGRADSWTPVPEGAGACAEGRCSKCTAGPATRDDGWPGRLAFDPGSCPHRAPPAPEDSRPVSQALPPGERAEDRTALAVIPARGVSS